MQGNPILLTTIEASEGASAVPPSVPSADGPAQVSSVRLLSQADADFSWLPDCATKWTCFAIDLDNGAMVNDAKVVAADIETSNGVIHVIDKVILPKEAM